MLRFILIFGAIAGAIVAALMLANVTFVEGESGAGSVVVGYLGMIVALSMVFVGVKQYRDQELGGIIRFWKAMGLGLAIAAVAGTIYTGVWEIFWRATDGAWADVYMQGMIEAKQAEGLSAEDLRAEIDKLEQSMELYANWWFRMPISFFAEFMPVGVIVSGVSAAVLRNPKFLPARVADRGATDAF